MRVPIRTVPSMQDPSIVIECIRACIWAKVEGRPFCTLTALAVAAEAPRSARTAGAR